MGIKNKLASIAATLLLFTALPLFAAATSQDTIIARLQALPGVSGVEKLQSQTFNDKYLLYVEQYVDHKNPATGTFKQRVYLMNVSFDCPMVMVTEGYGAGGAANPRYREEISRLLNTNLIVVEHRYFLESTPENRDWQYLTAENSANDHHKIRGLFGEFYKGPWIATGISKGGQTALIYRAFFPNDVDITVPYVAPLCRAEEDGRHEIFLSKIAGSAEDRLLLENFQKELLNRRAELQPKFDSLCTARKYTFNLLTEEIYDYSVLEFPFAFWQWGSPISEVPAPGSKSDLVFEYFMKISSPDYFVNETPTTPFFVQASRELGYYGYATKPFKSLLKIKSSKGYLDKLVVPEDGQFKFDRKLYNKLRKFVATTDKNMLFIYGEYDPWSSVMVTDPKNSNVIVLVQPEGSHRTRISTLPEDMRERAISQLNKWLAESGK